MVCLPYGIFCEKHVSHGKLTNQDGHAYLRAEAGPAQLAAIVVSAVRDRLPSPLKSGGKAGVSPTQIQEMQISPRADDPPAKGVRIR
jgi:hypothetical protein